MLKKMLFVTIFPILLVGCAAMEKAPPPPQEIVVKVQATDPTQVEVKNGENVHRSMQIPNQEGTLSPLSFIIKDEAFVKIFSALSVGDVTNLWNDICVLTKSTNIRNVNLFINSPGGDAFSGLALADQI
ncbi:MAG: ATP-dependent Clp protease proteolytic subunit, partial [Deltaproteobacteria bacterium]